MAINEDNISLQNSPDLSGLAAQANKPKAQFTEAPAGGFNFSFANPNGMFGAPIGRGLGSEFLTKLVDALKEDFKSANKDITVEIIGIDNTNETSLQFSVAVVCMGLPGDNRIGYHTLILEATGEKITPLFEAQNNNNGTNQIEISRFASDAANNALYKKVGDAVQKSFPKTTLENCDSCVVPRLFNPDDKSAIHNLAFNAGLAISTQLQITRDGFRDLNLRQAMGDTNLVINVAFQQQQIQDSVGEPVRSDVLINFTAQKRQENRQQQLNSGDRDVRITEASAFIDLIWAPVNQSQMLNVWGGQPVQQGPNQKYAPRAIITNLGSNLSYTPSTMLLAILSTLSLAENNNWIQAFRPIPVNSNDIDLRDVGALNIEANLNNEPNGIGTRIDTKSASFGLAHLGSFIMNTVRQGLILSADVPEAGPQTWYLSPFSAAANGNSKATKLIFEALKDLTNGAFARHFPADAPMFIDTNNRVHLGHWTDRNGNRRDIRDIDLLAVANLVGERDPDAMRQWSDTFTRTDLSLNYRLAIRKKMIYALTNETAEFTGWAQRVTFSTPFLDALIRGAQEAGLALRVNTPLSAADFNNQRGVADFVNGGLLGSNRVFNQQNTYGSQQTGQFAPFVYNQARFGM